MAQDLGRIDHDFYQSSTWSSNHNTEERKLALRIQLAQAEQTSRLVEQTSKMVAQTFRLADAVEGVLKELIVLNKPKQDFTAFLRRREAQPFRPEGATAAELVLLEPDEETT